MQLSQNLSSLSIEELFSNRKDIKQAVLYGRDDLGKDLSRLDQEIISRGFDPEKKPDGMPEFTRVSILKEFLPDAQEKLSKHQRKAKKLGLEELSFSYENERLEWRTEYERDDDTGEVISEKRVQFVMIDIVVRGVLPKFSGWKFISKIEPIEGGQFLIKSIPSFENVGEWIEKQKDFNPSFCDHCKKNRQRNETFLVQHENSEIKQVGRSCLKDFVGSATPHQILAHFAFFKELEEMTRELGSRGWEGNVVTPEEILTYTFASIRLKGYKPSSFGSDSTRQHVSIIYSWKPNENEKKLKKELEESVRDSDKERAKEAIEWASNLTPTGDYLQNLKTLLSLPASPTVGRNLGLVVSGAQAYLKAMDMAEEIKKKQAKAEISKHVGEEKNRLRDFELILVKKIGLGESRFNGQDMFLYVMEDKEGNVFKWTTANKLALEEKIAGSDWSTKKTDVDIGQSFICDATVKKHDEYQPRSRTDLDEDGRGKALGKAIKQTVLNRIKVKSIIKKEAVA